MHDGYTLEIIYLCFIVKENYWNYCRATKGQFNYLFFIFIFKLPKVTRVVFSRKKRTLPLSVVCSLVIFCGFYNLEIMVLRSLKVQVYFSYLELLHTYRRQYFCIMCHKTSTFYFHYRIKLQFSLQIIAKKNHIVALSIVTLFLLESHVDVFESLIWAFGWLNIFILWNNRIKYLFSSVPLKTSLFREIIDIELSLLSYLVNNLIIL